jgi:hypothetical protein
MGLLAVRGVVIHTRPISGNSLASTDVGGRPAVFQLDALITEPVSRTLLSIKLKIPGFSSR